MELETAACERARLARDPRFDGRFFIGVVTTGVYCRPICPVHPPKAINVRFYATAAAAREAGFRPCLRCRPEAAPGTPAWRGTTASLSRALRLIDDGVLDEGGVEALADRMGMGARHLRRLFVRHLGAPPVTVAQTRRLSFAKRLIDETRMPMTDVATASGFRSVRRFNDCVRRTYGRSPTTLRKLRARREPCGGIELQLSYRPPLAWNELLGFLRLRAIAGVERVDAESYRRTIRVGAEVGWIDVRRAARADALVATVDFPNPAALPDIVDRTRRLFDLDADPRVIEADLRRDRSMARLVREVPGLRVPGAWDPFEAAVRVIVGQQVTVAGASRVAGQLARRFGVRAEITEGTGLDVVFPSPDRLSNANIGRFGMPRARARAIRSLARAVSAGRLRFDGTIERDELHRMLVEIDGIGDWTANVIRMRALSDPDAFPASDLGILRAASNGRRPTPSTLRARAEAWAPWRAYATMHLWRNAR